MPIIVIAVIFVYIYIQIYVFKYFYRMIFFYSKQKTGYKIKGLVVTLLFFLFNWSTMPHYHVPRTPARSKACFGNMRVIKGSVEMYNMDNEKTPMKELDINTLISSKYLKSEPEYPEKNCFYYSKGDLSNIDDGEVYCRLHGSVEHPNSDYEKLIGTLPQKSISEKLKTFGNEAIRFVLISFGIFHLSQLFHW